MKSRVSSTVTKRKPNPRPRKYASASERQAAYRDRAPEVCFRAEPKTVETLDRIADTIDRSRAELLLSMTKFALTNHDWERFGLTHKTLPRYEGNPIMATARKTARKTTTTKRKPTPAQLAARERFAEMARAGSFKKAGGRKANPARSGAIKWASDGEGGQIATIDGVTVNVLPLKVGEAVSWDMPPGTRAILEVAPTAKHENSQFPFGSVSDAKANARNALTWALKTKTNPARKAAGVKRNPASTARFKFVCIAPLEYSGSKYGIDERTPVTLKFAKTEPAASTVYACYQLPAAVVNNDDFQNFAYHNKVLYMSIAQLRTVLKGYAK